LLNFNRNEKKQQKKYDSKAIEIVDYFYV